MRTTIGIILFPFMCLLLSFFVLLTDQTFTYLLLDNPDAVRPTKQLMQYFWHKADVPEIFTADEKAHLADVRQLISYASYLLEVLVIAVSYCMIDNWRKVIRWGSGLLAVLLALAALIPFDALFTHFHKLFFPQGNWMFAADSTLIKLYPETFFASYGIAIGIHALLAAFVFLIVSRKG